jgi:hypothetical protein
MPIWYLGEPVYNKKEKLSACRGEGSAAGLQLHVRFVPAALCYGLHRLSSAFLKLEIGQVM